MSCLACTKGFGFFTKEVGCPSCGFSFCSKCLKKTIEVPRLNNKKHKVCLTCYDRISKISNTTTNLKQIDNPMDADLPPECTNLSVPVANAEEPLTHIGSANTDEAIKQRLNKLKEDRLNRVHLQPSSDQDIAIRIANLKGERYLGASNRDLALFLNTNNRSDQEKSNDLVAQYMTEAQLDEAADPVKDIERRLAVLKGSKPQTQPTKSANSINDENESDSENDEEKIKRLVGRYMEDAALAPAVEHTELTPEEQEFVSSVPVPEKDQEELPWCVICNEDSVIRYQGDLFCRQCYKEAREDE